jgi:hypothetical protein
MVMKIEKMPGYDQKSEEEQNKMKVAMLEKLY